MVVLVASQKSGQLNSFYFASSWQFNVPSNTLFWGDIPKTPEQADGRAITVRYAMYKEGLVKDVLWSL